MRMLVIMLLTIGVLAADEPFRPQNGEFPPAPEAKRLRGELVFVDHVNRRGSLRLHVDDHFREGRLHHFAMLPYGEIRYRGAPAELRDIPVGTVLYGRFYLPPEPRTSAVPEVSGSDPSAPAQNHAVLLQDGPSLCLAEKKNWKLQQIQMANGQGELTAKIVRGESGEGLDGTHVLTVDGATRVWRGRELLGVADLVREGIWPKQGAKQLGEIPVWLALGWHPRYLYQKFHVSDIWLDRPAMDVAIERQRQIHIRHIRTRWMPALVEAVEYGQFGAAVVTVTLFGGADTSLYADFKPGVGGKMAASENTLRTWWPDHDGMDGRILSVDRANNVPIGSSGITVRFEVPLVLEGFRSGSIVRLRPENWPNVKPPVEERVRSFEDRWPSTDVFLR